MGNCPSGDFFDCFYHQYYWINQNRALLPMAADSDSVTVSGFSSGSSFSMLMQVVYSESIKGAGLIAGTPYGFGLEDEEGITVPDSSSIYIELAADRAGKSYIDATSNIENAPIYILGFD